MPGWSSVRAWGTVSRNLPMIIAGGYGSWRVRNSSPSSLPSNGTGSSERPPRRAARVLGHVVGIGLERVEAQVRARGEVVDHPVALADEGADPLLGDGAPGEVRHVLHALVLGVVEAGVLHGPVVGHPHGAGRHRGRPAPGVALLDDQDLEAEVARRAARRSARRLPIPSRARRPSGPIPCAFPFRRCPGGRTRRCRRRRRARYRGGTRSRRPASTRRRRRSRRDRPTGRPAPAPLP